jgi:hypothetical protein
LFTAGSPLTWEDFTTATRPALSSHPFKTPGGREPGKIETKPYLDEELAKTEIDSTALVLYEASGPVPASTN